MEIEGRKVDRQVWSIQPRRRLLCKGKAREVTTPFGLHSIGRVRQQQYHSGRKKAFS
jgi:hypothetical protein